MYSLKRMERTAFSNSKMERLPNYEKILYIELDNNINNIFCFNSFKEFSRKLF